MLPIDLAVSFGPLTLKNPLVAASGCFGYGVEYADVVDLASLGAVAVKGLFLEERQGHVPPRIVETPSGMLNAIGLQGIGVRRFIDEKLPPLCERGAVVIVNICGSTVNEYAELARILSDADGVAALELNISCPNIKEGGITFGCSLDGTHEVVAAVRRATALPIIPKLTPNVTDVASYRHRDATPAPLECRWWAEWTGHPPDRDPDGVSVSAGGLNPDHGYGRDHDG
jgi:dihydroorotate dehydrogenase (NAD+) catalytic subunit